MVRDAFENKQQAILEIGRKETVNLGYIVCAPLIQSIHLPHINGIYKSRTWEKGL